MTNRLYVANIPSNTTEDALRAHFATCGGVSYVEFTSDRPTAGSKGLARVEMTSPAFAEAAIAKLDGVVFHGKPLRVSLTPVEAHKPPPPTAKILQQFRERGNMAYELDCEGVTLTLRIFPSGEDAWRMEVFPKGSENAVSGEGPTRRAALDALVSAWNQEAVATGARPLDGVGLLKALSDVKAA